MLRYYNVDARWLDRALRGEPIDDIPEGELYRMFSLLGNLPKESSTTVVINDGEAFGYKEWVLALIEFNTRTGNWMQSVDGEKGRNRPEVLLPEHIKNSPIYDDDEDNTQMREAKDYLTFLAECRESGMNEEEAYNLYCDRKFNTKRPSITESSNDKEEGEVCLTR